MADWQDPTVIEAASWRLASELIRRHPDYLRLIRAHPGDGQSDLLWMFPLTVHDGPADAHGDIRLNRRGTIQVTPFDGSESTWGDVRWEEYLRADPREFLGWLEVAAGLESPSRVPPTTARTLTLRVVAGLVATAVKSIHPIAVRPGYFDSSGYGGSHEDTDAFRRFPDIPGDLRRSTAGDLLGQAGYRFWFVEQGGELLLAFEQSKGLVWNTVDVDPIPLMDVYRSSGRNLMKVLARVIGAMEEVDT